MLTALAKRSAAASRGRSHTWMVSRWPGTAPLAVVRLANGATLPRSTVRAGVDVAAASPLPPTIVRPAVASAAVTRAANVLVLDMVPLPVSLELTSGMIPVVTTTRQTPRRLALAPAGRREHRPGIRH